MPLSLAELAQLLPSAPTPAAPALPTGIGALDAALPGGGLPRGRLTEVIGATGSGKTTLARAIVEQTVSSHGWVAYIDAQRTLDPRDWVHLGDAQGVWMIRPHDATRAAWCADVLLRSGAFALVVLDSAPLLSKSNAVRLTRLARDASAALVILAERAGGATQLGGAVRLRVERPSAKRRAVDAITCLDAPTHNARRAVPTQDPQPVMGQESSRQGKPASHRAAENAQSSVVRFASMTQGTSSSQHLTRDSQSASPGRPSSRQPDREGRDDLARTIDVRIEKGGTLRTVEVSCAIAVARRLCTHPEVPDRRGVARGAGGNRHTRAGEPASAPTQPAGEQRAAARKGRSSKARVAAAHAQSLG